MKRFEIINPSDKAFIEGDFPTCVVATLLFGGTHYGLKEVDGDLTMPVFLLGGCKEWTRETFGKTPQEMADSLPSEELAKALLSVTLAYERSSLNDFTSYAHKLGNEILKKLASEE